MKFSQALMAEFSRVDVNGRSFLHWQGTYPAFLEFARKLRADASPAGEYYHEQVRERFNGCDRDFTGAYVSADEAFTTGLFPNAVDAFAQCTAKLEVDRFIAGPLRPAVAGGAWIVPLALASNPMPARIRVRAKLPPVNLELAVSTSGFVGWQNITHSLARIARAAWDYIQAGGAVTITAHYVAALEAGGGIVLSLRLPITAKALLASACSAQVYRAFTLSLRNALQGVRGAPPVRWRRAGLIDITGRPADDDKALQAFKIL